MRVICLLVALLAGAAPAAAQPCRQALVLALDVSGSVNDVEFAQQVDGLAGALESPDVRALILSDAAAPVSIAVFEWSSRNHQNLILPWVALTDSAALDRAIARIRAHRRLRAGLKTATGTAMSFAAGLLEERRDCWRRTIDVSGDGRNNIGPTPAQVYGLPRFAGVTVNALVVGDPGGEDGARPVAGGSRTDLLRYFEDEVILGAGAFAMIAEGYPDYARAMRRKLMRELAVPVFGSVPRRAPGPPARIGSGRRRRAQRPLAKRAAFA